MPNHSQDTPRPLPERPNLRHLKDQAKDLLKAGGAKSITDAQFQDGVKNNTTSCRTLG